MKKYFLGVIFLCLATISSAETHVACSFNADGEITSSSDCSTSMSSYTVYVKDVLLCTADVTPSNLSNCSSMGISMTWTATPTTVTEIIPTKNLREGTYTYLAVIYENTWSLTGSVSFSSSKTGATGSGKYCNTRNINVTYPGHDWSVRANYAAECGSIANSPEVLTWRVNAYNNSGTLFTETNTSVNGLTEKNYLITSSNVLSTSTGESARVLSVTPLASPLRVTHNKQGEDLGTYVFTYQLGYGLKVNYDGANQKIFVPGQIDVNVSRQ